MPKPNESAEQIELNENLGVAEEQREEKLNPEQVQEEKEIKEWAGLKDDEQFHSPSMAKRFRALYREAKESKRTATEKEEDNRLMREHMKKVMTAVEKSAEATAKLAETKEDDKETAIQKEMDGIKGTIKDLKQQRIDARASQDWSTVDRLEDEIEEQKEALQGKKVDLAAKAKKVKEKEREAAPIPDSVIKEQETVNKWAKDTTWYNPEHDDYNARMVADARVMDNDLKITEKWKGKPVMERIKFIQDKIEKDFGYKQKTKGNTGAFELEAPGDSHDNGRGDEDVSLNSEEKKQAHLFFDDMVGAAKAEAYFLKQKKEIGLTR